MQQQVVRQSNRALLNLGHDLQRRGTLKTPHQVFSDARLADAREALDDADRGALQPPFVHPANCPITVSTCAMRLVGSLMSMLKRSAPAAWSSL
jgi:hypothetical protein